MGGPTHAQVRAVSAVAVRLLGVALLGALLGVVIALFTPAHVEIAGSDTRVWLQFGRTYDQVGVDGVLTAKRATTRSVLGEPLGVRASIKLDASELTDAAGQFNVNILPAYIQAYSDPKQLVSEVQREIVQHFVVFGAIGAGGALLIVLARLGHRRWRARYDREHWPGGRARAEVLAYRAPERIFARRALVALVLLVVVQAIPASGQERRAPARITGDPIFAGTPLTGVQVQGLLRPALVAVKSYIETYFDQTNTYYDQLRTKLEDYLAANPVQLPGADSESDAAPVAQLGFVTDRHCNIGMDRVVVALLKHFNARTLVSAGDDAFSGTFGFESACTRNLADKTARAGIADVFVGGNHDSPQTIADEAKQGITTLTDHVVEVNGLRFAGSPDPRTSRYGQGIVPSAPDEQRQLLDDQGTQVGAMVCTAPKPVILVLHDPEAGRTGLAKACGHATVALDGHTHKQHDPSAIAVAGGTAEQFTGASSGGAPTETSVERTFASQLTVGPLNHEATVNIVTIDRSTGALVGVTEFHFTPDQTITVTQQVVG